MSKPELRILHFARFADMDRWSANASVFDKMQTVHPLVPLSKVLKRTKKPITVKDSQLYKRITVRLYGQGVLQRDEPYGKDIGTKRQFVAHSSQLIISRIDARNGAFGLVPNELDGAIVTNDFWLFDVHGAVPQYLALVLSSEPFQQYWKTQSSGTTNRQRVNEEDFLTSKIALPPIDIQQKLLAQYNSALEQASSTEKEIRRLKSEIHNYLFDRLHISCTSAALNGLMGIINFRELHRWDPPYLARKTYIESTYTMVEISKVIDCFLVDCDGVSLRRNTRNDNTSIYQYIGMENIERDTGIRTIKEVNGSDILSQTMWVPPGYMIYGKLRPYLNKYWENNTNAKNIICSSEFFVFDTRDVYRRYFINILTSDIIQKQLNPLYSGARMPRITENDFLNLRIPLPPWNIQCEISAHVMDIEHKIAVLRQQAENLRRRAKKEFEEAVFSGT